MAFSSKITRRLITSLQIVRPFAKRANPGLNYQISAIEDAVDVIQSDPEGFGGLESDLFNAHKSHKEHELEQMRQREKIKHYLIKNKYFRMETLPNLLTYAEKEQIRYLHSADPEEWTVEKLADSFPANATIISKIIKSDWTPLSLKRVHVHDLNVIKNWDRFKKGEYKSIMPTELEEHLNNFVNRDVDMKTPETLSQTLPKKKWQKPTSTEFSTIITTLRKKSNDNIKPITLLEDEPKHQEMSNICLNNETYLRGEIKNKKPMTIHELRMKQPRLEKNEKVMLSDEANARNQFSMPKAEHVKEAGKVDSRNDLTLCNINDDKRVSFNEVNITEVDKKLYGISQMKQRIHIPRKLWRKGATYRAHNCFYDDDGEFLYKVPGMF